MDFNHKATKIELFNLKSIQMRTFHMTWFSFFLCFFGWFGIAPLMVLVREEFALTQAQIGNTIIASVAITIFARLFIGWLCDRIGPRLSYTGLLIVGALPVMSIGFAHDYQSFLIFRLAIGAIGAAFVITQYHTSLMFAPNCLGTANATTAGWGNLGGGVTQIIMPLMLTAVLSLGVNQFWGWRIAMVIPGIALFLTGIAYYFLTQDSPEGNFADLRRQNKLPAAKQSKGSFLNACKDHRVWALFLIYGACFGIELTINNIAALYFIDYFSMGLAMAGVLAGLFGLMNIFARTLGGFFGDFFGIRWGLKGRVQWLFVTLFAEGIMLILFSRAALLPMAIVALIGFSLFVQMSEGATFSVVPFINKKALGSVTGIVGAGGNFGAVMAGFLFKGAITWPTALLIMGIMVIGCSFLTFVIRFSKETELEVHTDMHARLSKVAKAEELVKA
ncbi:MAG: NNP family nitrate/nitrite transporter-like MFS transporter [Candidatus Omnitrophota bacterium]|jgi:NNP family nitrate/nitrite transporter-like MFS transporter